MATTHSAVAQEQALVPTFIASIGGIEQTCVDARFLHAYLQNGDHFAGWINARLQKYGFEEGSDFECISEKTETQRANGQRGATVKKDYRISLDMAKELSMVENNDRGREARRYFIAMERKALGMANAVAPVAPQASSAEQLTASDMQHLKRMVWAIASNFQQKESASQGVWKHLRLATNNPAPYPYTVEHIPTLGAELQRLLAIGYQVRDITAAIEAEAIRRIFRRGELASQVLTHIEAKARQALAHQLQAARTLPTWLANDIEAFSQRRPCLAMGAHYAAEQPDFFGAAA